MTLGKQHPDLARFWLHTERPHGHGIRIFLRLWRLTTLLEFEWLRRNEWTIYLSIHGRINNVIRIDLGPGVIPF